MCRGVFHLNSIVISSQLLVCRKFVSLRAEHFKTPLALRVTVLVLQRICELQICGSIYITIYLQTCVITAYISCLSDDRMIYVAKVMSERDSKYVWYTIIEISPAFSK